MLRRLGILAKNVILSEHYIQNFYEGTSLIGIEKSRGVYPFQKMLKGGVL